MVLCPRKGDESIAKTLDAENLHPRWDTIRTAIYEVTSGYIPLKVTSRYSKFCSARSTNCYSPFATQQLILLFQKLPVKIKSIVYCERKGAPDIFVELDRHFLTTHESKETLPDRKLENQQLLRKLQKLYLDNCLELEIYLLVSKLISNLVALENKKKRANIKRRKTNFSRQIRGT